MEESGKPVDAAPASHIPPHERDLKAQDTFIIPAKTFARPVRPHLFYQGDGVTPIYGPRHNPGPHSLDALRYTPGLTAKNAYRTIIISNLSQSTNYEQLFSNLRGGIIVQAQLLKTSTITKTATCTALVHFFKQDAAEAFAAFAKEHGVIVGGLRAEVTMLATPTWFIQPSLRYGIEICNYSRCFEVTGLPEVVE